MPDVSAVMSVARPVVSKNTETILGVYIIYVDVVVEGAESLSVRAVFVGC